MVECETAFHRCKLRLVAILHCKLQLNGQHFSQFSRILVFMGLARDVLPTLSSKSIKLVML